MTNNSAIINNKGIMINNNALFGNWAKKRFPRINRIDREQTNEWQS